MAVQELENEEFNFPSIGKIILWLAVGIFFTAFTFPRGLTKLGSAIGWSWVQDIGTTAKAILVSLFGASLSTQMASFNLLWSGVVIALSAYIVSLALLSIRHRRLDLIGLGLIFLFCGTAILHLLSWSFYIAIIVLGWVFQILGFIFGKLSEFFGFIFGKLGEFFGFLAGILVSFFGFIARNPLWLLAILPILVGIYFAARYSKALRSVILWALAVSGILGALYLLIKFLQFLSPFVAPILGAIGQFLAPIFAFIGRVLGAIGQFLALIFAFIGRVLGVVFQFLFYVLIGLCVCCIICGFGRLLFDQFNGAWKSGNERRGVILGSLAIGTSIALVLLESNLGNVVRFYPADLPSFIASHLYQGIPPTFDVIITLLVVSVSIVGVLRNLPELRTEPSLTEFQSALLFGAPVALVVSIVAIGIASQTESNN